MHLLICAATEFEIKPTIDFIERNSLSNIDVLITGVGLTSATYQLTKSIFFKRPELILQAGIAGCFDEHLSLGSCVVIKSEIIGDLGVEENEKFHSLFEMKLLDKNQFPWTNGKLINTSELVSQINLPVVDALTINEISTNKKRISFYKNECGATVESMEGAALHYVGLMENISFLQIRSLSNFVGERNKSKWLMKEAIESLND